MPSLDPFEDDPSRSAKAAKATGADNIEVAPGLEQSRPTIDPRVNSSWSALEAAGLLPKKGLTSDDEAHVDRDGWPTETSASGTVRVIPPPPPPASSAGPISIPAPDRIAMPVRQAVPTPPAPPEPVAPRQAAALAGDTRQSPDVASWPRRDNLAAPLPTVAATPLADTAPSAQAAGVALASFAAANHSNTAPGVAPVPVPAVASLSAALAAPVPAVAPGAPAATAPGAPAATAPGAPAATAPGAPAATAPASALSAAPAAYATGFTDSAGPAADVATQAVPPRARTSGRPATAANPASLVRGPRVVGRTVGRRQLFGRRPRVRKVSRVVRRIDGWTVFKISLVLYGLLYVILVIAGVLLWHLAYTTGTVDNIQGFIKELFGLKTFVIDGKKLFQASRTLGLVMAIGGTGLHVTLAVLFNLIADLVGGVRVTVLEEEVILRERDRDTASAQSD